MSAATVPDSSLTLSAPIDEDDAPDIATADPLARETAGAQTLFRGLDILELVAMRPMTAADVIRETGLTRATAARFIAALVARQMLGRGADGTLRLGPRLMYAASRAAEQVNILSICRPYFERFVMTEGLSIFLGRRDGDFSVHLDRHSGREHVGVSTRPGDRRALPDTGMGKALMLDDDPATWTRLFVEGGDRHTTPGWEARMHEHVRTGVVIQQGPPPDRIRSVAAPIRDAAGRIVAAISVATAAQNLDDAAMAALAPRVLDIAAAISGELGWVPTR
ncbi:IclR family transcriptional regulator [Sphingomonas mollis]|uniref:IclR family transcriptional regulator n=1 Tax=Sphingomonas mollis TaxID=2795726 RepID=A0ABS0XPG4_9SPHN|nr:IclR family transcriptional regulator [Sphingomonas sp. BT553]MBJ6121640.1 IclR family transcriptional regulator [Sphingomonas sp. BT553]